MTAYEMRISDWSSDVCSSDLRYETIRQLGYAVTKGERDPESAAIACPVFSRGTTLFGALSVVIPLYRFNDNMVETLVPEMKRTAFELSQDLGGISPRSEEHTSELQSLMRISYAVFCLKNKKR